jgi:transcriptional regulator with XRE-family HTH domain
MGTEWKQRQVGQSALQQAMLAWLRRQPTMSQSDLARAANLTGTQISEYLNGKRRPRRQQLVKLAPVLEVPVEDLEDPKPKDDALVLPEEVASVLVELARWADLLAPSTGGPADTNLLDALDRARACARRLTTE